MHTASVKKCTANPELNLQKSQHNLIIAIKLKSLYTHTYILQAHRSPHRNSCQLDGELGRPNLYVYLHNQSTVAADSIAGREIGFRIDLQIA